MNKELLLNLKFKSKTIKINGEEWEVRELSAGDSSEYQSSLYKIVNGKPIPNLKDATLKLVLLTLFKNNEKVFGKNDLQLIKDRMPASIVNEIATVATELNGLNDSEENEKN